MKLLVILMLFVTGCASICTGPGDKGVDFANLKDGQVIKENYKVNFLVNGMQVLKAGEVKKNAGHHHLIINNGSIKAGAIIPKDKNHLHFGGAQTSTVLKLKPGKYTLTLQFADGAHASYGKAWSKTIYITVK